MSSNHIMMMVGILALIVLSAFFALSETAFSSINRIRMKSHAESGNKKAALALRLSNDYGRTLSTVLVGNTIVNIATASISAVFFVELFGAAGVTLSTVVTTVLILVFSEVTPKTIAKENPEHYAMMTAPMLHFFSVILRPVNYLFDLWKKVLARLIKTQSNNTITEEELRSLVDEAEQEGAINVEDKHMIQNAFEFNDSYVKEILTPRLDLVAYDLDDPAEDLMQKFLVSGFTRIPVYRNQVDEIQGFVHLHDVFALSQKKTKSIQDIIRPVLFIPSTTKISSLLKQFQKDKVHLAVVIDEYGGVLGIATLEDVLEELVGEIWDEKDEIRQDIRKMAGGNFLVLGKANIKDVLELFYLEASTSSTSVNGWIAEQLGHLPVEGDVLQYKNLEIKVLKTQGNRILECIFKDWQEAHP